MQIKIKPNQISVLKSDTRKKHNPEEAQLDVIP